MGDENRTGKDVERTITEVLSDLASNRVSKGATQSIRDAADGSLKRGERDAAVGRAFSKS